MRVGGHLGRLQGRLPGGRVECAEADRGLAKASERGRGGQRGAAAEGPRGFREACRSGEREGEGAEWRCEVDRRYACRYEVEYRSTIYLFTTIGRYVGMPFRMCHRLEASSNLGCAYIWLQMSGAFRLGLRPPPAAAALQEFGPEDAPGASRGAHLARGARRPPLPRGRGCERRGGAGRRV